jgi:hypothetical protein
MADSPAGEAKKVKAFKLANEFLALIEAAYHDDRDEGMVLMILVDKFIVKYQIDPPERFLRWLNKTVKHTLWVAAERQAARRESDERDRRTH